MSFAVAHYPKVHLAVTLAMLIFASQKFWCKVSHRKLPKIYEHIRNLILKWPEGPCHAIVLSKLEFAYGPIPSNPHLPKLGKAIFDHATEQWNPVGQPFLDRWPKGETSAVISCQLSRTIQKTSEYYGKGYKGCTKVVFCF